MFCFCTPYICNKVTNLILIIKQDYGLKLMIVIIDMCLKVPFTLSQRVGSSFEQKKKRMSENILDILNAQHTYGIILLEY